MAPNSTWRTSGWIAGVGVFLTAAVAASRPFWPGELARHPWMTFLRDDFFYYLLIARHFAAGQGSTFNALVRTNGYHPLWMLLLAALCRISLSPFAILAYVAVTAILSTLLSYWLSLRLLARCGIGGCVGALGATFVALNVLPLCYYGMEVTLAMPAALALALHALRWSADRGARWWLVAGLFTSLLMLARTDAVLFALLLAAAVLSAPAVRASRRWRDGAALAIGCAPALVYLVVNRMYFGLWMPISGAAKQMRSGWTPALNVWIGVLEGPRSGWVNLLLVFIALCLLAVRVLRRRPPGERLQQAVLAALLLYPWLFVLLLSIRSDWGMWPWYAWVWRPATCAAVIVLLHPVAGTARWRHRATLAALIALLALRVAASVWRPGQLDFYQAAVDVQRFSQSHPGIYAMGDRAGMAAWLLPYPLVQTEGLVMDKTFLEHIRRQDPLLPVLRGYGVRYYIANEWAGESLMEGDCFHAAEPSEILSLSPRMQGLFCDPPLMQVTHQGITTRIYAVR